MLTLSVAEIVSLIQGNTFDGCSEAEIEDGILGWVEHMRAGDFPTGYEIADDAEPVGEHQEGCPAAHGGDEDLCDCQPTESRSYIHRGIE